ncbi:MAG: hypothetical protein AB7F86_19160 [Bdellovibrionales bacterium]
MNRFVLMVSVLALTAGCATKKKKTDVAEAPKPAVKTEAPAKVTTEEKTLEGRYYTCQVLKDKRVVQFKTDKGRCEIHYTKFGSEEQVAWGEATPTICSDAYEKIRSNIEAKGFKCSGKPEAVAAQ